MSLIDGPEKQAVLRRLRTLAREQTANRAAPALERFVGRYYEDVADEDLAERSVENLFGAALAHWNAARQRRPGVPIIRILNPEPGADGWGSTHTVVQIVCDDMPFLVDSVRIAINELGFTNHFTIHPIMRMVRDPEGRLLEVLDDREPPERGAAESLMHFELTRETARAALEEMRDRIDRVLGDVRAAVEDWGPMREKLGEALRELGERKAPIDEDAIREAEAFLQWLNDDNFTFLGYREYEVAEEGGDRILRLGPGLGVLRGGEIGRPSKSFAKLSEEARDRIHEPGVLVVTKATSRSTVHRAGYMDYVGVKGWDADGRWCGERRFVGLYTSTAYNHNPRDIPLLRRKIDEVLSTVAYPANSHAGKALLNILETFPRDALFQIRVQDLLATATAVLQLEERQRVRLFVLRDLYRHFFTCLVYIPRDRFDSRLRVRIQELLQTALGGEGTDYSVQLSESVLARLCFVIRVEPGVQQRFDVNEIQARIVDLLRSWSDGLSEALVRRHGEERASDLLRWYGAGFRADYREYYGADAAVRDIEKIESLKSFESVAIDLYRRPDAPPEQPRLKLFRPARPISLSRALPMLENMGFEVEEERPSTVKRADGERFWIHDFGLRYGHEPGLDVDRIKEELEACFARVWAGAVENDSFNRLVLHARLSWREVVILRAYCKYLRQAPVAFSQEYMARGLSANPAITRRLVELFRARFDPERYDPAGGDAREIEAEIESALDAVASLDEDRILRSFLGVIRATLRTNFFQLTAAGGAHPYFTVKLDPSRIPELPQPRPMFEIFVYSPRVEGVHLRGGSIARGGLRWSDRREDFRTEVLGLVKAQMVKNAVIVPMGSKGGFVPKALPVSGTREEVLAEGVKSYQTFVRGLLEITDNIVGTEVAAPAGVVRYDGDDPYLVVAADKGTATFSDIANDIAEECGFWLGDAFASGGSVGYDHKKMGITARGAWESVKRHFREIGIDTQGHDFTVVGIGDMSGDVFGNGMLLSKHIKLVGAFNHLHVFLDPDPDPDASFAERRRLFELPRSSWADYDAGLISTGGGVFPRSAKAIPLSPEVKRRLGVEARALTPNELIRALLRARVDLLWNGGIGTYVKAQGESHADVGDRANDGVRVDATELGCRVVGEGGNLGLTQLGRIELAQSGTRVNTDAIDNSGGVDCSDHEVNIKILLNGAVADGEITRDQRNRLLEEMTEEVARHVLRNNYLQTQALSLANAQAASLVDVHERLIEFLEREGHLVRGIEFLPDKEQVQERRAAGRGMTSPELSVLLAYVKIHVFQCLVDSGLPDDPYLAAELERYFPEPIRVRFRARLPGHRLHREIIATTVANGMVNRAGITFAFRLGEETGATLPEIARAFLVAREVFEMDRIWAEIEALDNRVSAQVQVSMLLDSRKLVERATRWLLRNRSRSLDIRETIARFAPGIAALAARLDDLAGSAAREAMAEKADTLTKAGVPSGLATRLAAGDELPSAFDIVEVARLAGMETELAAEVYFTLGTALNLRWIREQVVALPRDNRWQALARTAMRDDLYRQQRELTLNVATAGSGTSNPGALVDGWVDRHAPAVARCRQVVADLMASGTVDFSMLSVAMREFRGLRQMSVMPEAAD